MTSSHNQLTISQLQQVIKQMYGHKDESRGIEGTFMWFMEELGELSSALRSRNDRANLEEEFADVLAWLVTLANMNNINLEEVVRKKYALGCPRCHEMVCCCQISEKP
jgi:NTP pyrophosphatase (non-canonical NTP hydrolase)